VSRSAVSRTFTEGASVSEETRRKVLPAAEELNYHVNHLACGLSQEKSRPICILGGDLHAPYQSVLLEALTRRIQAAGRAAMVINTAGNEADTRAACTRPAPSTVSIIHPRSPVVARKVRAFIDFMSKQFSGSSPWL
jgi:DNA-binding LacI/PurR family transcriptional regulator